MKNKDFSSLEVAVIITIFLLVSLVPLSFGIIILIQEDFSRDAIIMSIFMFGLSIASFFALGLGNLFKKEKKDKK